MSDRSGIEWTDATWNPVTGCTKVSPGCEHCYAETFAERWRGVPGHHFQAGFDVTLRPAKLDLPLRWRRPRRIFVNSMSDLFQTDVPDEYIAQTFAVMMMTAQHTYQMLTKRHGRMRSLLSNDDFRMEVRGLADSMATPAATNWLLDRWPLPNVWLGVSVEDQKRADLRIPALLDTPAAVRWVSAEPLLGPVDLSPWLDCPHDSQSGTGTPHTWTCDACGAGLREVNDPSGGHTRWPASGAAATRFRVEVVTRPRVLDWVVAGGESGPGARPMHPDWPRGLRDQCADAGVPFLFKQWGGRTPKAGGRTLDGRTHDAYPATYPATDPRQPA